MWVMVMVMRSLFEGHVICTYMKTDEANVTCHKTYWNEKGHTLTHAQEKKKKNRPC